MADIVLVEGDNILDVQLVPILPPLANLYGIVTDADTGLPISSVLVTINGQSTYTDINGNYAFMGLAPGSYVITFEKDGYETLIR